MVYFIYMYIYLQEDKNLYNFFFSYNNDQIVGVRMLQLILYVCCFLYFILDINDVFEGMKIWIFYGLKFSWRFLGLNKMIFCIYLKDLIKV